MGTPGKGGALSNRATFQKKGGVDLNQNQIVEIRENEFENVFEVTVNDMKTLGTYRQEFSPVITRYAELRVQFSLLMKQWYESGCVVSEKYTNKAGATNIRKTALYLAIESLRKELRDFENDLGLTPAGLRRINDLMKNTGKKESKLAEALKALGA